MNPNIKQTHQILKELINRINFYDLQLLNTNSNTTKTEVDKKHFLFDSYRELLDDPNLRLLYGSNMLIKEYIFDSLVKVTTNTADDLAKRECLEIIDQFILIDYDEEILAFRQASFVKFYATKLSDLVENLNDLTIEQSFYSDETDSSNSVVRGFENQILSLIRFVLKTISLKKLFKLGFKQRHVQFLVINFTNSPFIPKIIEAISSQYNRCLMVDDEEKYPAEFENQFMKNINTIHLTTIKSISLMFKLHANNSKLLDIVVKINENLRKFYESEVKLNPNELSDSNWKSYFGKIVSYFTRKIYEESEKKYRRLKFELLYYYINIVKVHYPNLNLSQKRDYTDKLIFSIKRILNVLENSRKFSKLDEDQILVKSECFFLIREFIIGLEEEFVSTQLKQFINNWLIEINFNNHSSIECLIILFKIKSKKLSQFSQNIISLIEKLFETKQNSLSDFRFLICSIFEYESENFQLDEYNDDLISLVNNMQIFLKENLSNNTPSDLDDFVSFNHGIILSIKTKRLKSLEKWERFAINIIIHFEELIQNSHLFNVSENVCFKYMELMSAFIDIFYKEEFIQYYISTISEMIIFVKSKLSYDLISRINQEIETINKKINLSKSSLYIP